MEIQNIRPPPFKLPDKSPLESSDPPLDHESLSAPISESTPSKEEKSLYQLPPICMTPINNSTYFNNSIPVKIEPNSDPGTKNTITSLQRLSRRVKIMMKPKGQLKSLVANDKMQLSTLTILPHYMEEIHAGQTNNQNFDVSSGIYNEVHNYNPGDSSSNEFLSVQNGLFAQSFNEQESLENVRALRQNLESLHSEVPYSLDSLGEETIWPMWDGTDGAVHFV